MPDFQNYFTFSSNVQNLLFKNLSANSDGGMFGLCMGVAVFTFLYEAVKALRHYLVILQMRQRSSTSYDLSQIVYQCIITNVIFYRLKFHVLQTMLHMLQLTMGYMVMLIVMSFNAWFIIVVIITTALCFYFHEFVLSRKSMILPVEIPGNSL
ncbi:probable low affinity copper uptake protein 2 [Uloborus diversus]|uniref:probable low affinity copper uptake protein 2 n=1 Tax=Uloborus diversus TaxID=327109 RepID=UPI0024092554|nr:probable low affinity copper uptake protein 2 [Uloborus diversus]